MKRIAIAHSQLDAFKREAKRVAHGSKWSLRARFSWRGVTTSSTRLPGLADTKTIPSSQLRHATSPHRTERSVWPIPMKSAPCYVNLVHQSVRSIAALAY